MNYVRFEFSDAPYPGLRPFRVEESDIFFGREKQTDQLLERLVRHRFLAVTGPSGCGKSSLVRAGMIPALNAGFMVAAGSRWRVCQMRPGSDPIGRLAASLATADVLGADHAGPEALPFVEAALRRGPLGLVEAVRESTELRETNLLLVVDQFEEIFRYREESDDDDADDFVALLLASANASGVSIYVTLTMRSDHLGDCAVFYGLPEAVNDGQYLTPRLTRDECQTAIVGPARVFGADIDGDLVNRLLNDFGSDPDRLPPLQHALMRMWNQALARDAAGKRLSLSLHLYEEIGGLQRALSRHADEVLAELDPEGQRIAQVMFKRLTERRRGSRDGRSPARLAEVARIAGVEDAAVVDVAEAFGRYGRSFVTRSEDGVLDISHESLIQLWEKLADWVVAEAASLGTYRRVRETARLWTQGKAALWGDPDLDAALGWRRNERPTPEWAARFGHPDDFPRAMQFLDESARVWNQRMAADAEARRRELRRNRAIAGLSLVVAVALALGIVTRRRWYVWESFGYYNSFVKKNGVPVGIGPLSLAQVRSRPSSFEIVSRGTRGPVVRMRSVDSALNVTASNVGTYLENPEDQDPKHAAVEWRFDFDDHEQVNQETAYGTRGNHLWTFLYLSSASQQRRKGIYLDALGLPFRHKQYASSIVEIDYSVDRYESRILYVDRVGRAVRGRDRAYGQRSEYDSRGHVIRGVSLGPDGRSRMNDDAGNSEIHHVRIDHFGNVLEAVAYGADGAVVVVRDGYSRYTASHDKHGRMIEAAFWDSESLPCANKDGFHRTTYTYDARGRLQSQRYWNIHGQPAPHRDAGCHGWRYKHDGKGNVIETTCLDADGNAGPNRQGYVTTVLRHDAHGNIAEEERRDGSGQPVDGSDGFSRAVMTHNADGSQLSLAYYASNGAPALSSGGFSREIVERNARGAVVRTDYLGPDGQPIVRADGYSAFEQDYDDDGNIVHVRYFGPDGKPTFDSGGVAGWKASYDARGNRTELVYLGIDGTPVLDRNAYAIERCAYDNAGNAKQVRYLGVLSQPVLSRDGVAGWNAEYDAFGNQIETTYVSIDGTPAIHRLGYARMRTTYDAFQRPVCYEHFDLRNRPIAIRRDSYDASRHHGYARQTISYASRGGTAEETYSDASHKPVLVGSGFARITYTYDRSGNHLETAYFGASGEPTLSGEGYHRVQGAYDERGNMVDFRFLGLDASPVNAPNGYARVVFEYDRHGRPTASAIFGSDDQPVAYQSIHRRERTYDTRGHLTRERYLGPDRAPTLNSDGYHSMHWKRDALGRELEVYLQGVRGEAVLHHSEGYARKTLGYDSQGNQVSEEYFGLDDRLINTNQGYARAVSSYDRHRRKIEERYYAADRSPTRVRGVGQHVTRFVYDRFGSVIEQKYLAPDRRTPAQGYTSDGDLCRRWTAAYDAAGIRVRSNCDPVPNTDSASSEVKLAMP